jgi:predicted small secreted protein
MWNLRRGISNRYESTATGVKWQGLTAAQKQHVRQPVGLALQEGPCWELNRGESPYLSPWQRFCFCDVRRARRVGGSEWFFELETVMAKVILMFAILFGSSALLAACNTTEGFGKDVKHTGQSIENSAADNK